MIVLWSNELMHGRKAKGRRKTKIQELQKEQPNKNINDTRPSSPPPTENAQSSVATIS